MKCKQINSSDLISFLLNNPTLSICSNSGNMPSISCSTCSAIMSLSWRCQFLSFYFQVFSFSAVTREFWLRISSMKSNFRRSYNPITRNITVYAKVWYPDTLIYTAPKWTLVKWNLSEFRYDTSHAYKNMFNIYLLLLNWWYHEPGTMCNIRDSTLHDVCAY